MKKYFGIGLIIVVASLMKLVFAGSLDSITPELALSMQTASKAIIMDVREPSEVSQGKIKGALTIPMSVMNDDRPNWDKSIGLLKKDQTVVVYCRSGRRSTIVGEELLKKGFKVLNLGGFDSWKSKGLPTD